MMHVSSSLHVLTNLSGRTVSNSSVEVSVVRVDAEIVLVESVCIVFVSFREILVAIELDVETDDCCRK